MPPDSTTSSTTMTQQQTQGIPPTMLSPDQASPDMAQNSYYQQEQGDITGGLPLNLDSLRDGPPGSKPFYPYSTLIRYAIKGSPNQKLLLEDIYYAIESRFPYFRTAPSGWKNSVRHNLSLNPCFEKVPRPLTDRGKGSYWTVNDNVDPRTGVHRVRKKKPKGSKRRTSEDADVDYHPPEPSFDDHTQYVPPIDEGGPNRPAAFAPYPPGMYSFDPVLQMMGGPQGMRFPPLQPIGMPIGADESIEMDEHGNVNWRLAWLKELAHLQQITAEQEKQQVDQEWYRMMLFRLRTAFMAPINPTDAVATPPHGIPPPQSTTDQP